MSLEGNFLKTLVQANELSPNISGKLYTFDDNNKKFSVVAKTSARTGFRIRWFIILVIALSYIVRVAKPTLLLNYDDANSTSKLLEKQLSIMMIIAPLVASERYRIRCNFPHDFVSFFNSALIMEKAYSSGIHFIFLKYIFCLKNSCKFKSFS